MVIPILAAIEEANRVKQAAYKAKNKYSKCLRDHVKHLRDHEK